MTKFMEHYLCEIIKLAIFRTEYPAKHNSFFLIKHGQKNVLSVIDYPDRILALKIGINICYILK